jgi:hypothetical protein
VPGKADYRKSTFQKAVKPYGRVVVHEGGQAIVGSLQGSGTPPAAQPLAIARDHSGITEDDLIEPRELVVREGVA